MGPVGSDFLDISHKKAVWKGNNPILRGLTNHGYEPLAKCDDPPSNQFEVGSFYEDSRCRLTTAMGEAVGELAEVLSALANARAGRHRTFNHGDDLPWIRCDLWRVDSSVEFLEFDINWRREIIWYNFFKPPLLMCACKHHNGHFDTSMIWRFSFMESESQWPIFVVNAWRIVVLRKDHNAPLCLYSISDFQNISVTQVLFKLDWVLLI